MTDDINPHTSTPDGVKQTERGLVSSIYLALMLVVLSIIGIWMLIKLQTLLVLLFVSVLIATSLAGPVNRLEKWGLPRTLSILFIYLFIGIAIIGIIGFTVPPLLGQIGEAANSLPDRMSQFENLQNRYKELEAQYPVLEGFEDRAIDRLSDALSDVSQGIVALPAALTTAVFVITSLMTLSLLMLTTWPKIEPGLYRLIHPDHRAITERVLRTTGNRLGAYVRAKAIISTIVAIWMYIPLTLLNSKIALLLAITIGLFEIIPRIGPIVGRFILVVAVLPAGWEAAIIVFVLHMIIDNIKGSWLSPLIEGHQVEVHPLAAFVAVIAGAILMGWMGALIAVPTVAVLQVIVEEVLVPWRLRQLELASFAPAVAIHEVQRQEDTGEDE